MPDQPTSDPNPTADITAPLPPPAGPPSTDFLPQAQPKHSKRLWLLILLLLVVIIAAVIIGLLVRSATNNSAAAGKKDIPLLNYGIIDTAEISNYPLNYENTEASVDVALQLYEGLVGFQDQTKIVPLLASSWSNPDDNTWIFNLRKGIKFHTGRTLTAQDVKFTLDYAIAHQNDDSGNSVYLVSSDIKQVTVTGTYQVKITTNSPDAVLLYQLGLIGIVDSKAKLGDSNAGTGPYVVKPGTSLGKYSADLVAAKNYWGGHIYTKEVKITINSNSDQMAQDAEKGDFDLVGTFANQPSALKVVKTLEVPEQGLSYIGLATERAGSPLQTLAARQAIPYALDIPDIIKAEGVNAIPADQVVPLLLPGHNSGIQSTPYDPAKAKQLLASVPNASMPLTFAYPDGDASEAKVIAQELDAVGFNIKLLEVDDFNAFISNQNDGVYDMFVVGDTSSSADGLDILSDLLVGNEDYDNPQIDSLLTQTGATLNASERIHDMEQVATLVYNDKPLIPLYSAIQEFVLTKPYVVRADLPNQEASVYFWQVYQQ